MFDTTDAVGAALTDQDYIPADSICTVLYLAEHLGKPILAEGPAGVGKTELGKVWAAATDRRLIPCPVITSYEATDGRIRAD